MSNASRGRELEHRARDELRAAGYSVARVRGSLGPADLLALPRLVVLSAQPRPLLVQVKGGPRPLDHFSAADWNELFYLSRDVNGIPVLATKPGRSRTLTWQLMVGPRLIRGARSPLGPFSVAPLGDDDLDPTGSDV